MANKYKKDLITVIVPTHERVDTLERALKSVESQTYKNIEIIVVDDNSELLEVRKKVEDIVAGYKVKLVKNTHPLGGGETRNNGIRHAKGKFIVFLDDDDEMYPEKIEKQYELYRRLNDDKIGMIYCYANFIYPDKIVTKKVDYEGLPLKEHLISCIAATSWWFCQKKALEDVGGFVDLSSHQDAVTLFNMLKIGYKIYRVPEVLLKYYAPDGNGITKISNEWVDVDRTYMKLYSEIENRFTNEENKEIQYSFYRRMSFYDYTLGNKRKLYSDTFNMVRRYPFRIGTFKGIVKCFFVLFKKRRASV